MLNRWIIAYSKSPSVGALEINHVKYAFNTRLIALENAFIRLKLRLIKRLFLPGITKGLIKSWLNQKLPYLTGPTRILQPCLRHCLYSQLQILMLIYEQLQISVELGDSQLKALRRGHDLLVRDLGLVQDHRVGSLVRHDNGPLNAAHPPPEIRNSN